jgi:hypothetical protein
LVDEIWDDNERQSVGGGKGRGKGGKKLRLFL